VVHPFQEAEIAHFQLVGRQGLRGFSVLPFVSLGHASAYLGFVGAERRFVNQRAVLVSTRLGLARLFGLLFFVVE
jgi:hypothetical protein